MSMPTEVSSDDMISEINMTPFVDVMLVLLIIFLVTLPLVHQAVNIELPKITNEKLINPQDPLKVSIDREGFYLLDQEIIELDVLRSKLMTESQREPKPVVLLYADKNARYEDIAKALATIHQSGIGKIGFITQDASND
jgi:biopolymer transport protein ExbD